MSTGLPSFPQTISPNTVLGRSGIDAGPVQALPFGVLQNSTLFFSSQINDGTVNSGTATLNVSAGPRHLLTVGGPITVAFTGWPLAPVYAEIEIELVNGGLGVIWPTVNWLKGDGTNNTSFVSMGVTLNLSGTNFVIVWSRNAGATLWGKAA